MACRLRRISNNQLSVRLLLPGRLALGERAVKAPCRDLYPLVRRRGAFQITARSRSEDPLRAILNSAQRAAGRTGLDERGRAGTMYFTRAVQRAGAALSALDTR